MATSSFESIAKNPTYQQLITERRALSLWLTAAMCVIYYGFILLVAYAPGLLGASVAGGVTTVGIVLGLLVIVAAFVLTGVYVRRANSTYDDLTQKIVRESAK